MEVSVNYLAVLLAALSSMAVGSLWYSKMGFAKQWMKWTGLTDEKMKNGSWMPIVWAFVLSLLTAYILAHVTFLSHHFFNNSFMLDALTTAFWLWLGIGTARLLTHELFEMRPYQLLALNAAHEFVTIMIMGLIIGLMGA